MNKNSMGYVVKCNLMLNTGALLLCLDGKVLVFFALMLCYVGGTVV